MIGHTPEPWEQLEVCFISHQGTPVAVSLGTDISIQQQDAYIKRIVKCCNACEGMDDPAKEIATLRAQVEGTEAQATRLAEHLHKQHFRSIDTWRVLAGDPVGIITQIDNMVAGISQELFALRAQVEAYRGALTDIELMISGNNISGGKPWSDFSRVVQNKARDALAATGKEV